MDDLGVPPWIGSLSLHNIYICIYIYIDASLPRAYIVDLKSNRTKLPLAKLKHWMCFFLLADRDDGPCERAFPIKLWRVGASSIESH